MHWKANSKIVGRKSWPMFGYSAHFRAIQRNNLELNKNEGNLNNSKWFFLLTLKSMLLQHLQMRRGLTMRSTVSFIWFFTSKSMWKYVDAWVTRPMIWPGGDDISNVCKQQHGKQQHVHASGRSKWITSFWWMSQIFISNGRIEPRQNCRKQFESSMAQYTYIHLKMNLIRY